MCFPNGNNVYSLNAAGTPIIKDFPLLTSSAKLTLLPGESSTRTSSFGMLSPTLTKRPAELWKDLIGRAAVRVSRRRAAVVAMIAEFALMG
jgi:hypothetical protein